MRTINVLLLIVGMGVSFCSTEHPVEKIIDCSTIKLRSYYSEHGKHEMDFYTHYVIMDGYEEECFSNYDFIEMAYKYIDTVKHHIPIKVVSFCSSDKDFDTIPDNQDWGKIRSNFVIDVCFKEQTLIARLPQVQSISVWKDGVSYEIDLSFLQKLQSDSHLLEKPIIEE